MKKRFLCIFLIISVLCMPVQAAEIWAEKTEKTVTDGVQLISDKSFSAKGWKQVHILEIDLENEDLQLTALFDSRGISHGKNVLNLAEENSVVAAVNGDFFNWSGTPLGFTVEDGRVISSPSHDPGLAAFLETEEGEILFEYLDMTLEITCPEGYKAEIIHINKVHSMESMVLYTSDWGEKTPGSFDGVSELVVKDGVVQEIRLEMEGVEVPADGYVVATSTKTSTYLVDNFKVGDPVELSYALSPNIENIRTAIGGGTVLVKDGKIANFTNIVSGSHPRTAIGVDKAGETLYLVTVDGRKTAMPGFTQTELAEYMIAIGAHSALNLDGGGSTTMVARTPEKGELTVVNTVSEGALRPIVTALGVEFTGKKGKASSMELFAETHGLLGEGIGLSVAFYDRAHNPVTSGSTVRYSSKDGKIKDGVFYPSKSGVCTVKASAGTLTDEKEITVLAPALPYAEEKPETGESILLLPALHTEKTFLNGLINKKLSALAESDGNVYTLGKYENVPERDGRKFSITETENALFVTLNAGNGSLREADSTQWEYIMELCEDAEKKNIFFLLSTPLSAFKDEKEAALFVRMITERLHAEEKEVFVISSGEETDTEEKNGVRYISVPQKATLSADDIYNPQKGGVRFTLSEDGVYFETVPLFSREGK